MIFINATIALVVLALTTRISSAFQNCRQYTPLDYTICFSGSENKTCNQTEADVCASQHSYAKINIHPYGKALKGNVYLIFGQLTEQLSFTLPSNYLSVLLSCIETFKTFRML